MFHERHQHALDRHAQLIEDARAVHLARSLQGARPRRWQFTWRLRSITLHLPLPHVTATSVGQQR
ncbi:hypothetical protein [Deinococcus radiotolerans]|uniref:hypothetical protein n=1 Tax=Deinococcus radiotolerans TaxID=1309407 RepID=UPI0016686088|nr:hypothetical protein [Deinococcus radiotolerans]